MSTPRDVSMDALSTCEVDRSGRGAQGAQGAQGASSRNPGLVGRRLTVKPWVERERERGWA